MTSVNTEKETFLWRKRIYWLLAGVFFIGLIVSSRLFQKSVLEHSQYIAEAKNQYITRKEVTAERGQIFAHDDPLSSKLYPLATNTEKYSISAVPKNVRDKQDTAHKLAQILDLPEEEIFSKINNNKLYIPPLKKRTDKEIANKIVALDLEGILILPEEVRIYPEGSSASQVLGFVNTDGVGQYGLEGYYNSELKGRSGEIIAEKDTQGRLISAPQGDQPVDGSDLILSIDHNVQYSVEDKLKAAIDKFQADSGSVIIVRPQTGAIIAMASLPSYDPNKFSEVLAENQSIFLNPATSFTWEPGSIFKPISMAAALAEGKIEPSTEGDFSNYTVVDGHEIHTAQDKAFGRETMTNCLENSDNVCLVWVTEQIGKEVFYKYVKNFGFGDETGVDLDSEAKGYVMPLDSWKEINRATISFGQGISSSPLQMLMSISSIANGGKLMKPYLVEKIIKNLGEEVVTSPKVIRQVVSAEVAGKLTSMMIAVVENGHGKKASVAGYKVAGKTGTAQVMKPDGGYYEDQHIGSFAGFFPADNPEFAMLVKLDNPKNVEWAESSAAPTFGEIASYLLKYYQIPTS